MRWLKNIYDPDRPDALEHVERLCDETPRQARKRQRGWLADKVLGSPLDDGRNYSPLLAAAGYVGVYEPDVQNTTSVQEFAASDGVAVPLAWSGDYAELPLEIDDSEEKVE